MTAYRVMQKTPPGRPPKKVKKKPLEASKVKPSPSIQRRHNPRSGIPFGRPAK
jgi:hypothetical protein